jgi:DeoR/GlpR family transcriptional regulator of sugar metabolism
MTEKAGNAGQRRNLILEQLRSNGGSIHVEDLSRHFGVSVATVRRDLDHLGQDGLITRTYGGAVIGNLRAEQTLRERAVSNASAKDAIARSAAELVQPGSTVLLDAGTTTGQLSRYLARIPGLTVLTNGLNALNVFAEADTDVHAIALGGSLRPTNQSTIGPIAEAVVRSVHADIAFVGTDCLDAHRGVSSRTLEQNSLKTLMMAHARRSVVLADSSKLNADWSTYWAPLPDGCTIITDNTAGSEALQPFEAAGNFDLCVVDVQATDADDARAS